MGKGKGITAIVFFAIFIFISIGVFFGISTDAEAYGYDSEIAVFIIVELILLFSTAFLIPGIICLLEMRYDTAKWYYALIPVTLLWILVYTIVIAILAPTSFVSDFQEFLGLGIGGSIALAIIALCASYEKFS